MIEALMQNPYAWLMLTGLNIIGFIITVYSGIKGRRKKEISISVDTKSIISTNIGKISNLEALYKNQSIDNCQITTFYIWNSGTDTINQSDIATVMPLQISTTNDAKILEADVVRMNDKTNGFTISHFNSQQVIISFDYISSGDGIAARIVHTGKSSDLKALCKLKDGKEIRYCKEKSGKTENTNKESVGWQVIDIVLRIGLLLCSIIVSNIVNTYCSSSIASIEFTWLCSLIIAFVAGRAYLKIIGIVRKYAKLNVPECLKNNMG